jgi:hypothetical protein
VFVRIAGGSDPTTTGDDHDEGDDPEDDEECPEHGISLPDRR